jgi:hypothetical protein
MTTPTNCPLPDHASPWDDAETIACCRVEGRYRPRVAALPPTRTETEVSTFDDQAVVRIGRLGDEIALR